MRILSDQLTDPLHGPLSGTIKAVPLDTEPPVLYYDLASGNVPVGLATNKEASE